MAIHLFGSPSCYRSDGALHAFSNQGESPLVSQESSFRALPTNFFGCSAQYLAHKSTFTLSMPYAMQAACCTCAMVICSLLLISIVKMRKNLLSEKAEALYLDKCLHYASVWVHYSQQLTSRQLLLGLKAFCHVDPMAICDESISL